MKTAKDTLLRNGIQKVRGSNPLSSTNKFKGFRHSILPAFPQLFHKRIVFNLNRFVVFQIL